MFMLRMNVLIFVTLLTLQSFEADTSQKVLLTVFYESNCPDSKEFILRQLQPAIRVLYNYVKLKLVPFGKSRSLNYGDDGFVCQHGPAECLGNIVQDCALLQMANRSDLDKLAYVACEMTTEAASQGNLDCVEMAKLPLHTVENCALSGKGISLQLESEYLTSLVKPKFIPTVTVDQIFNQDVQDNAQIDLVGTLCAMLVEVSPCAQYYNNMALSNLMHAASSYFNVS